MRSVHCCRIIWANVSPLAKQRSKIYRKWKRRGDMVFWQKYKDLDKLIKRTTRDKKRALLEEFSRPVLDESPSLIAKRVNKFIKLRANRAATATERGNSLDRAVYTRHVQQLQPTSCGVSPQHFNVPEDFENELVKEPTWCPRGAKITRATIYIHERWQECYCRSNCILHRRQHTIDVTWHPRLVPRIRSHFAHETSRMYHIYW